VIGAIMCRHRGAETLRSDKSLSDIRSPLLRHSNRAPYARDGHDRRIPCDAWNSRISECRRELAARLAVGAYFWIGGRTWAHAAVHPPPNARRQVREVRMLSPAGAIREG